MYLINLDMLSKQKKSLQSGNNIKSNQHLQHLKQLGIVNSFEKFNHMYNQVSMNYMYFIMNINNLLHMEHSVDH